MMSNKIRIGVSACLLGEKVRFDAGHKNQKFLTETLSEFFKYQPFCPEVAIGLGVPRSSLRLIKDDEGKLNAIMPKTNENHTEALSDYADKTVQRIQSISGYVLKSKSPSCGMNRVRVYDAEGNSLPSTGVGIFAQKLMEAMPNLPIEEEGRLNDNHLRENFIKHVFVYKDWQDNVQANLTHKALVDFHTRHKLLLILHHYGNSKILGKLLVMANEKTLKETSEKYLALLTKTLRILPQKRHHGQVLTRVVVKINKELNDTQKKDILNMIDEYTAGEIPLSAPIRMVKHYLTAIDNDFLNQSSYLNPYPESLGLMNGL